MKKRTILPILLALAGPCALLPFSSAAQNLLINGDFENEPNFGPTATENFAPAYVLLTGSQLPGWTIVPGHGVTIHSTTTYPTISGNYSVNTDGEGYNGHNADFYQDFTAVAGTPYQLGFDWQGWLNNAPSTLLKVSVIDTVTSATIFSQSYGYDSALHHQSALFNGAGDVLRLEIQESPESGFNDNQFIADNFSVTAVPEPAAISLLASGGLACVLRRKRATAL